MKLTYKVSEIKIKKYDNRHVINHLLQLNCAVEFTRHPGTKDGGGGTPKYQIITLWIQNKEYGKPITKAPGAKVIPEGIS